MRFYNTQALKQKKIDYKDMHECLVQENRVTDLFTKKLVKDIFEKMYTSQLELVIKHTLDEKK